MSATALPVVLGAGWGALAGWPLLRRANRASVTVRLPTSSPSTPLRRHSVHRAFVRLVRLGPVGRVVDGVLVRRRAARREAALVHELPVVVDLMAVAVGAGCTPYLAVEVAAQWSPPHAAAVLTSIQRDCSLGVAFADALESSADVHASMTNLASALLAADRYGAPVGDALERVAAEERAALRRRAEARARTVPVRLLFPLVFLVLPAFALLTVVPALLAGFSGTNST